MPGKAVGGSTPGLTLVWSEDPEELEAKRERLCHPENSGSAAQRFELLHGSSQILLGLRTYPGYPVSRIEDSRFLAYREGALFGPRGQTPDGVTLDIVADAWRGNTQAVDRLLNDTDGEFLIVGVSRTEPGFVVVGDVLGRLPVYMSVGAEQGVLSRDRLTVTTVADLTRADRIPVAQFLALGCVLGRHTLVEGMDRFPSGGSARWPGRGRPAIHIPSAIDWSSTSASGDPVPDLVDLFREATRKRIDRFNLVSLSGGFDSRATAAALSEEEGRIQAATYLDPPGQAATEVPIARTAAERLGLPWRLYEIEAVQRADLRELLSMKFGANPFSMASVVPFLRDLRSDFGTELTQFTGDGGWILKDLRPTRGLRSIPAVVEYALHRRAVFPAEVACALAGVKLSEFRDAFAACIASYPEDGGDARYIRFLLTEMGNRFHSEGEDRNRCYFWSTSPFYGLEFFRMAMSIPQKRKSGHRLYSRFLRHLAPSVADLPHSVGAPAGSFKRRLLRGARRVAFRSGLIERAYRLSRPTKKPLSEPDPLVVCLRAQVSGCEAVRGQLSADSLDALVAEPGRLSSIQLLTLLTVTSCLEVLTTGSSSL